MFPQATRVTPEIYFNSDLAGIPMDVALGGYILKSALGSWFMTGVAFNSVYEFVYEEHPGRLEDVRVKTPIQEVMNDDHPGQAPVTRLT